jgi:hypothetical protein
LTAALKVLSLVSLLAEARKKSKRKKKKEEKKKKKKEKVCCKTKRRAAYQIGMRPQMQQTRRKQVE